MIAVCLFYNLRGFIFREHSPEACLSPLKYMEVHGEKKCLKAYINFREPISILSART